MEGAYGHGPVRQMDIFRWQDRKIAERRNRLSSDIRPSTLLSRGSVTPGLVREHGVKQQSDFGIDYPIKRETAPQNFLKLFYPFHYSVGMAVEKQLSGSDLTRHQTVILWIIHSKGEGGHTIHRKTIERLIGEWYELGSPAISKVLRAMADKDLNLISIRESKASAREKIIRLTKKGQSTVNEMMKRTEAFIKLISDELTDEEIANGMEFMSRVGVIVEGGFSGQKG